MKPIVRLLPFGCACALVCLFSVSPVAGQVPSPVPDRVAGTPDSGVTVLLRGNVHPLARPEFSRGPAADSLAMDRVLLLLRRSEAQEADLEALLDAQQDKSSPLYHAWLTPEEFGRRFGPSDADLRAVTDWLVLEGFHDVLVAAGRNAVEFSGTAGQVAKAFSTRIENYAVEGAARVANASDPRIPAALAPVVDGILSLHNFPKQSHARPLGTFRRYRDGRVEPLFTPPGSTTFFPLAPADFAAIYNVAPLLSAGIDGTGQSIAVVAETNVDLANIQGFRSLFGLPANFTSANVILNGPDPGITSVGEEAEATLDASWSGAVATRATILLVVSESTESSAGIDLSAQYIVQHNLAGVLSESYGECEAGLGAAGNLFYKNLWEQASAQGITVVLSSGDGGSAGCDNFSTASTAQRGLAVSGLASTPFNVAVGGTDFNQINQWSSYWNSTNDPVTHASAKGYIPESTWNDSCANAGLSGCNSGGLLDIIAGSGGASTLYSKAQAPWQTGSGDSRRDLPDISLFASNGFNGSLYILCQADFTTPPTLPCALNSFGFDFQGVGGTSAGAPAFAGIMALVNQKTGQRQGNANPVLYALAKTAGASCPSSASPAATCVFYDVSKGNISVPCSGKSPNCSSGVTGTNGILVDSQGNPAYAAAAGYDLATGLGSVNVANLVNKWSSVNTTPTSTTLSLAPSTGITHGSAVNVTAGVSPSSATGDVSLIADLGGGQTLAVGTFPLGPGGTLSTSTTALPGGAGYSVRAHYAGNGTNAPSDSAPVTVSVGKENSATVVTLPTFSLTTGAKTGTTPSSVVYGSPYLLRVDVLSASAGKACSAPASGSCASGTVSLKDNGNPLDGGSFVLNNAGYTEDQAIQLGGGAHGLSADYSGDNSFNPSSSAAYALTVTPAPTVTTIDQNDNNPSGTTGVPYSLNVLTQAVSSGAIPSGSYTVLDGGVALATSSQITSGQDGIFNPNHAFAQGGATVTFTTAGSHNLTVKYSGDANYAASTSATAYAVKVTYGTQTTMTASAASVIAGNTVTLTATVSTTVKTPLPSQNVIFYGTGDGYFTAPVTYANVTDAQGNAALQATTVITPFRSGQIWANFNGDANFSSSSSYLAPVTVSVITPDFNVAMDSQTIVVNAGQTASGKITVTPATNLTSNVTINCSQSVPPGVTCAVSPNPATISNGQPSSVTVSYSCPAPSASLTTSFLAIPDETVPPGGLWLAAAFGWTLLSLLLLLPNRPGWRRRAAPSAAAGLLLLALGCGGGSSGGGGGGGGGSPTPTTITLTADAAKLPYLSNLTLTAKVTGSHPLTGTVTFAEAGGGYANNPLASGVASVTVSPFYGPHTYTASYTGDALNQPSHTSGSVTIVVTGSYPGQILASTGAETKGIATSLVIE
jgi:Pro-kumamolisin, activation domain/Bacterial Ig-like domain (group 3)